MVKPCETVNLTDIWADRGVSPCCAFVKSGYCFNHKPFEPESRSRSRPNYRLPLRTTVSCIEDVLIHCGDFTNEGTLEDDPGRSRSHTFRPAFEAVFETRDGPNGICTGTVGFSHEASHVHVFTRRIPWVLRCEALLAVEPTSCSQRHHGEQLL